MIGRLHKDNHVGAECQVGGRYNPDTPLSMEIRALYKITNTIICEQMWRHLNRFNTVFQMTRSNFRMFLRHFCIEWNRRAMKMKTGLCALGVKNASGALADGA